MSGITPFHVLTVTTGSYSDAETSVVGMYTSVDAAAAEKQRRRGDGIWTVCTVPGLDAFHEPGTLDVTFIETDEESAARSVRDRASEEDRRRRERFSEEHARLEGALGHAFEASVPVFLLENLEFVASGRASVRDDVSVDHLKRLLHGYTRSREDSVAVDRILTAARRSVRHP